jgi:hypothetical protein
VAPQAEGHDRLPGRRHSCTGPRFAGILLVTGESGAGKSYLAGLLAERWMDAGYSVLVVDPEGDHLGLSERPEVHLVDAAGGLPSPHNLLAMLGQHGANVVLDLSALSDQHQVAYLGRLPPAIFAERLRHGVPHWVIYDEAHQQAWLAEKGQVAAGAGSCRVTWRPELLDARAIQGTDLVIHVGHDAPGTRREAFIATMDVAGTSRTFVLGQRGSDHVRHQHKYATAPLPPSRRFYFHDQSTADMTAAASTLEEFRDRIGQVDVAVVDYHAGRGDFSRWVSGVLADEVLARELAHIERDLGTRHAAAAEDARQQIQRAVQDRYLR